MDGTLCVNVTSLSNSVGMAPFVSVTFRFAFITTMIYAEILLLFLSGNVRSYSRHSSIQQVLKQGLILVLSI